MEKIRKELLELLKRYNVRLVIAEDISTCEEFIGIKNAEGKYVNLGSEFPVDKKREEELKEWKKKMGWMEIKMTAEQQKTYEEYIQKDVEIEDLDNHGWSCKNCSRHPKSKMECNFQDCLIEFISSGRKLTNI